MPEFNDFARRHRVRAATLDEARNFRDRIGEAVGYEFTSMTTSGLSGQNPSRSRSKR